MNSSYINYHHYRAENWWDRQRFLSNWWRILAGDPYWVPPYFPALRRALEPMRYRHLARMSPLLVHTEALPKRRSSFSSATFEQPVAAAVALTDSRRRDETAYLALLHCVNHAESLERLIEYLADALRARGYRRIIGPTGLSPYLGTGLLQDYWNHLPPQHTPYNPPYLPEVANSVLQARSRSQLYQLEIRPELPPAPAGDTAVEFQPLAADRLATDLQPLFAAACPSWLNFTPPDGAETAFLLDWLRPWPLLGWLAMVDAEPVGFILLQPDLSPRLRRANGGRNPLWRLWLAWASRRPARCGRVLYAAVLPVWRKQGLGSQLLNKARQTACLQGWRCLTIGPVPGTASAARFLEHCGARPRQAYLIYQQEL